MDGNATLAMKIKPDGFLQPKPPLRIMERTVRSITGREWKVIGSG